MAWFLIPSSGLVFNFVRFERTIWHHKYIAAAKSLNLPGKFVNMLGKFVSLPGQFVSLPGTFVSLQEKFVNLPGKFVSLPGKFVNFPGKFVSMPFVRKVCWGRSKLLLLLCWRHLHQRRREVSEKWSTSQN